MTANATQTCTSCGAAVWYARNTRSGKTMIIDRDTSDRGNIVRDGDGVRVLRKAELDATRPSLFSDPADLEDVPRWCDHHATCPKADEWRPR